MHYQSVYESLRGMLKRKRQPTDNPEIEAGPQFDRALVGADHEVELHRAKSALFGSLKGMQAHLAGDATPPCG
jgi:hypothetical protein